MGNGSTAVFIYFFIFSFIFIEEDEGDCGEDPLSYHSTNPLFALPCLALRDRGRTKYKVMSVVVALFHYFSHTIFPSGPGGRKWGEDGGRGGIREREEESVYC